MKDLETVAGKLRFVLLPAWLEDAAYDAGQSSPQALTDYNQLCDILSSNDVEKYILLNQNIRAVFDAAGLSEDALMVFLNRHDFDDGPHLRLDNVQHDYRYIRDRKDAQALLFDYFNDSELVQLNSQRYYSEIIPLHDNIMGVHIRAIEEGDDIKAERADALRRWIVVLRRYVSLTEVARSGFLSSYLDLVE